MSYTIDTLHNKPPIRADLVEEEKDKNEPKKRKRNDWLKLHQVIHTINSTNGDRFDSDVENGDETSRLNEKMLIILWISINDEPID